MRFKQIISLIDEQLKADVFNSSFFQNGNWFGVVEPISQTVNQETKPTVLTGKNAEVITFNSDSFTTYHRAIRFVPQEIDSPNGGFGGRKVKSVLAEMVFIVIADRISSGLSKEDIALGLTQGFPARIKQSEFQALNIISLDVDPIDLNSNINQVWQSEFASTRPAIRPTSILLGMRYNMRIESCSAQLCS